MKTWQIILTPAVFFCTCQLAEAQQFAPGGQPVVQPYPGATPQPAVIGQPIFQAPPVVVQQNPQGVPIYPPGSTVVPLPSQTPGSIFGPPAAQGAPVVTTPQAAVGPEQLPPPPGVVVPATPLPGQTGLVAPPPSTISVPVVDDDFAWDQIADVVSDYFKIAREQRVRRGVEGCAEGRIETVPRDSATWLEPHRNDSIGTFNRWESTFQSIRRHATVRVLPDPNGYLVEVIVEKELEDLPKPERATAGSASFSSNMNLTLPSGRLEEVARDHASPRWLSLGRDPALEQRMLAEIHARLNGITTARSSLFGP